MVGKDRPIDLTTRIKPSEHQRLSSLIETTDRLIQGYEDVHSAPETPELVRRNCESRLEKLHTRRIRLENVRADLAKRQVHVVSSTKQAQIIHLVSHRQRG